MNDTQVKQRPFYAPYSDGVHRMAMGLMALSYDDWLEVDEFFAEHVAEKSRLLTEHYDEVFQAVAGSEAGQREVLDAVLEHMTSHHPGLIASDGETVELKTIGERHRLSDYVAAPMDLAGRLAQEDLCLMAPGEAGYELVAASLCFPTRWRLSDKIGRPMLAIHGPVPDYAKRLGKPVDRFLDHLKADKPVMRVNWAILDDPALFQPGGHYKHGGGEHVTAENAGEKLYIRVERQTLRRMEPSGNILFTIKIHSDPLSCLDARPDLARALGDTISQVQDGMREYKSVGRFGDAIQGWVGRVAGGQS